MQSWRVTDPETRTTHYLPLNLPTLPHPPLVCVRKTTVARVALAAPHDAAGPPVLSQFHSPWRLEMGCRRRERFPCCAAHPRCGLPRARDYEERGIGESGGKGVQVAGVRRKRGSEMSGRFPARWFIMPVWKCARVSCTSARTHACVRSDKCTRKLAEGQNLRCEMMHDERKHTHALLHTGLRTIAILGVS